MCTATASTAWWVMLHVKYSTDFLRVRTYWTCLLKSLITLFSTPCILRYTTRGFLECSATLSSHSIHKAHAQSASYRPYNLLPSAAVQRISFCGMPSHVISLLFQIHWLGKLTLRARLMSCLKTRGVPSFWKKKQSLFVFNLFGY